MLALPEFMKLRTIPKDGIVGDKSNEWVGLEGGIVNFNSLPALSFIIGYLRPLLCIIAIVLLILGNKSFTCAGRTVIVQCGYLGVPKYCFISGVLNGPCKLNHIS